MTDQPYIVEAQGIDQPGHVGRIGLEGIVARRRSIAVTVAAEIGGDDAIPLGKLAGGRIPPMSVAPARMEEE